MYRFFIKRILDIIISFVGIIFLLLILIPISFLIWKEDKGPIFYNAPRLGKNMEEFKMYKFRTMKVNAEDIRNSDGTTYNSNNDPRVTKIGKVLRKTSLDEFPQFFNVLKGDMSFIGPRPSPLGDKSQYPKSFFVKYRIKPGITGYNQAILRNDSTIEQRIENDNYYVENMSFLLDLKILILTIKGVLSAKGINKN